VILLEIVLKDKLGVAAKRIRRIWDRFWW